MRLSDKLLLLSVGFSLVLLGVLVMLEPNYMILNVLVVGFIFVVLLIISLVVRGFEKLFGGL
jgi:hypothetical protein